MEQHLVDVLKPELSSVVTIQVQNSSETQTTSDTEF